MARPAQTTTGARSLDAHDDVTQALDVLARLLRLVGDVPVLPDQPDIVELRGTCDAWARHVLTLEPPPGLPADPVDQRAWGGLAQFLTNQRHREQELVAAALGDLRQAVVTIAEAVRWGLVREKADTDTLQQLVGGLKAAADDGTLAQLREEVRRATERLLGMSVERDERQAVLADEVARLSGQVQQLAEEVRLAQQASATDALTGLLNRAGFDLAIRRGLGLSFRTGRGISLALIDLDDLKWVNDQHGHAVGDAAIRALADSLRVACRSTDELARIGGDEFVAILTDADADQAARIVERFLHELWTRNLSVADGVIHVSASVGIAQAQPGDGPQSWIDRADQWLYRAKALGKNRLLGDGFTRSGPGQPPTARTG